MKMIRTLFLPALLLALLAGCATTPDHPPPEVMRLDSQLTQLENNPHVAANAPDELQRARNDVDALKAQAYQLDEPVFQHRVYITDKHIQTAEAIGLARYQEKRGEELGQQRDKLLLQVKSREAAQARQEASAARASAAAERQNAQMARQNAQMARQEAAVARAQLEAMHDKLSDLKTKQTKRGLVITLGDVLFEVDQADLKPGAARSLDQLAGALRDDPEASIRIEGHTDSTGSRAHNMDLSQRRADSVRDYLVGHGIDASRITTRGLGPDYPVASNKTAAGRQQNRRVEVIVSNKDQDASQGR